MGDALTKFKRLDVLVNCAGVMYYTLMSNCDEKQWHQQIGLFYLELNIAFRYL